MPQRNVEEIMSREVLTIADAVRLLAERNSAYAVVVDADGKPEGIGTERDVLNLAQADDKWRLTHALDRILAEEHHIFDTMKELRRLAPKSVGEAMGSPVRCAEAGTPMAEAARATEQNDYRQLPIVKDGKLIGIVGRHDIVRALADTE